MPQTIASLIEFATARRSIGVDLVHLSWIGDIDGPQGRQFDGVRTSLNLIHVPWNRIVFWCESRNKDKARLIINQISPDIWVLSMRDLLQYWKDHQVHGEATMYAGARQVYTSLKRLEAFSAAKDLASLCILHMIGGYFFDASVQFLDGLSVFRKTTKQPPSGWTTDTRMPVRVKPAWCMDAWALYAHAHSETTTRALDSYLKGASEAGINRWQGPDFYVPVTKLKYSREGMKRDRVLFQTFDQGQEELSRRYQRVGLIQDLINVALSEGWGTADMFDQRDIQTEATPILTLPEFALVKVLGSSVMEQDPEKWVGWKATPFRDWSTKRL